MAKRFTTGRSWSDGDVVTPGRLNKAIEEAEADDETLEPSKLTQGFYDHVWPKRVLARAEKAAGTAADFYSPDLAATHAGFNNEGWWRVLLSNLAQDGTGAASINGDNQLVLPAGTWRYRVLLPNIQSTSSPNGFRARLWNVTDGSLVERSASLRMSGTSADLDRGGDMEIVGDVTLGSSKTLEVQIRCNQGTGTTLEGFQLESNLGGTEYYCIADFLKRSDVP